MFISTVVCLVPVVDCSEAVGVVEMTEVKMKTSFLLVVCRNKDLTQKTILSLLPCIFLLG